MAKGRKVLVIDDNPHTLEILRVTLEAKNYIVKTARSGEEGIERFREMYPDAVLLDYNMPQMDGLEVLRRIKALSPYTPVVMMSAYGSEELLMNAMKEDVDDYLKKPLNTRDIHRVVDEVITKSRMEEDTKHMMKRQLLKDPFKIHEIYIIGVDGGLLYYQKVSGLVKVDKDILAGMFTAVRGVFNESFKRKDRLKMLEQGDIKILVEDGSDFNLVVIGTGDPPGELREKMDLAIKVIDRNKEEGKGDWDNMPFLPELHKFLGGSKSTPTSG